MDTAGGISIILCSFTHNQSRKKCSGTEQTTEQSVHISWLMEWFEKTFRSGLNKQAELNSS